MVVTTRVDQSLTIVPNNLAVLFVLSGSGVLLLLRRNYVFHSHSTALNYYKLWAFEQYLSWDVRWRRFPSSHCVTLRSWTGKRSLSQMCCVRRRCEALLPGIIPIIITSQPEMLQVYNNTYLGQYTFRVVNKMKVRCTYVMAIILEYRTVCTAISR